MLNSHLQFSFPSLSFFFSGRFRFFLNLTFFIERVSLLFFLTVIVYAFFSWSLSWSKTCFLSSLLSCFFYKFTS